MTDGTDELAWNTANLSDERVQALKAQLLDRVTAHETRHRRLRMTVGGVSLAIALAAISISSVIRSAPPAWSAVPTLLPISADGPMVRACVTDLPSGSGPETGSLGLAPLVVERRGRSEAVLLGGRGVQGLCVSTPSSRDGGRTASPPLRDGQELSLAGNGGFVGQGSGDRYVYGRVSSRVVAVSVLTTAGTDVAASVANGSYVAWWPASAGVRSITARDAEGHALVEMKP